MFSSMGTWEKEKVKGTEYLNNHYYTTASSTSENFQAIIDKQEEVKDPQAKTCPVHCLSGTTSWSSQLAVTHIQKLKAIDKSQDDLELRIHIIRSAILKTQRFSRTVQGIMDASARMAQHKNQREDFTDAHVSWCLEIFRQT
ncbi:hypothetical protein AXG93_2891s1050 [Marchantia polymorpha subsp. ruderalis]|uniref:Uncharacterized protein n=1 Tax=Marchantia polymorpha subsp. ruderalis TaxID=1480154 RepID=A0A176WP78_MARPO|nr:hypothetical protein AXG93_2891s1050 [Marchantia polymorpha subsp. ruderalis]